VGFNDTCWVDGCERQSNSSTKLCNRHLQQLQKVGGFFDRLVIRDKRKLVQEAREPRETVAGQKRSQRSQPAADRLRQLIAEGQVQRQADAVRLLNVSRQNISQLVKRHGIQLARAVRPRRARPVCLACRKEYTPGVRSGDGLCFRCNRKPNRVVLRCESCGAERSVMPSAAKDRKTGLCKTCYVRERGVLILRRADRRRRFWQIERNKATQVHR
jgi:hypothetical protein